MLTDRNLLVLVIGLLVAVLLIGSARLASIERKVEDAHNAARSADSSASSAGGSDYSFQVEYLRRDVAALMAKLEVTPPPNAPRPSQ